MNRVFLVFVLCLWVTAVFADDDPCKKGFERLVILSNNDTVSPTEFAETKIIVDSLQRNECYEYEVDKDGVVYAGASLAYLYGKICATYNNADAVMAYAGYVEKNTGLDDADIYSAFENLCDRMPAIVITEVLNKKDNANLLSALAKGFISNAYQKYFTRVNRSNYKDLFYKRYPAFNKDDTVQSNAITLLLAEIERELK